MIIDAGGYDFDYVLGPVFLRGDCSDKIKRYVALTRDRLGAGGGSDPIPTSVFLEQRR